MIVDDQRTDKHWIPQIGSHCRARIFSLEEANALFPIVRKVTHRTIHDFDPVCLRYRKLLHCDPRKLQVAVEYESIVRLWVKKMKRLGLIVNGLWEVSFDTGDGYLSWRYPEVRLAFFVALEEPHTRQFLSEVIVERCPDWA